MLKLFYRNRARIEPIAVPPQIAPARQEEVIFCSFCGVWSSEDSPLIVTGIEGCICDACIQDAHTIRMRRMDSQLAEQQAIERQVQWEHLREFAPG